VPVQSQRDDGFTRRELASLEDVKLTEDELALLKWRHGTAWNIDETNSEVA
jgi:hypothetical protein